MRAMLFIILALSLGAPQGASAGPWLREQGTTFTATTFTMNYFRDHLSTTYIEHGLRENLTLGADIGFGASRTGVQGGYGTVFMRKPLNWGNESNKWAYELGVGAAWTGDLVSPHVKAGLSWGHGVKMRETQGWATVDASMTWDLGQGLHLAKVDATVGLNFTDVTTGMMQINLSHLDGDTFATITPSLVFKPKQGKYRLQVGFEAPSDNFDDTAMKIGLWHEF